MAKKKFTKEHLTKLAKKGKGGLATWAKKQLGQSVSSRTRAKPKTKRRSRSSTFSGGQMARRKTTRRRASSGGMGAIGDVAIGGVAYGAANANIPAIAGMNPLFRIAAGYYLAKKASGIAKGAGLAILANEGTRIGAGASIGGLTGAAGNNTGGYM